MSSILEHYKRITFTGRREINPPIKVRLKDELRIRRHFDGTSDCEQVTTLTIGNVYELHAVEGFGDVADAFVTNDVGEEEEIILDWFDEAESEDDE